MKLTWLSFGFLFSSGCFCCLHYWRLIWQTWGWHYHFWGHLKLIFPLLHCLIEQECRCHFDSCSGWGSDSCCGCDFHS